MPAQRKEKEDFQQRSIIKQFNTLNTYFLTMVYINYSYINQQFSIKYTRMPPITQSFPSIYFYNVLISKRLQYLSKLYRKKKNSRMKNTGSKLT